MFDKMKALWDMQKKMQELKKQLDNVSFEVESHDRQIKITINGAQEVQAVKLEGELNPDKRSSLESSLRDTFNKAVKRSQAAAAEKMKGVTGFDIPGLT